jgi:transcription antitermination factor NusA-like protein
MTATRQRMLVIGKTDSTVPKIKELTGEKVEVHLCR